MGIIEKLRNRIGRYLLYRFHPGRTASTRIPHFDDLREIGILYDATNASNEEQINRIAHYLRDQGKKVWMMGFVDAKTLPHTKKFHISSEYFWKEKLTRFNLPEPSKIGNFLHHRFDLLMNLYLEDNLPLQAMSTYTQASYAMGAPLSDALRYNDSVIDVKQDGGIHGLATQMVHYLKVINQP